MSTEKNDIQIKQLFDELRRHDEQSFPEFHEVLNRKAERHSELTGWLWPRYRVIAALALMVILVVPTAIYFSTGSEQSGVPEPLVTEITDWESPTEFLMSFPGETLIDEVPELETDTPAWVTSDDWSAVM